MKTNNLSEVEFFYIKFLYNNNVLIPRFDTESLVRKAIELIKREEIDALIDVWTGSAIIPIAIEKNTKLQNLFWLEKSAKAIKIADINKKKNNSSLQIIKSDLLSYFLDKDIEWIKNKNLIITANLPYIKNWDWINMSSDTKYEPKMALFWWYKTWFELYQKFYKQIIAFKAKYKPNKLIVITEIWFDQKEVAKKFLDNLGIDNNFFKDLCWVERFIVSYI